MRQNRAETGRKQSRDGPEPVSQLGAYFSLLLVPVGIANHSLATTLHFATRCANVFQANRGDAMPAKAPIEHNQRLRLGLDLGTNSIGWVLYVLDDSDPARADLTA